jgi:hypothetical protein
MLQVPFIKRGIYYLVISVVWNEIAENRTEHKKLRINVWSDKQCRSAPYSTHEGVDMLFKVFMDEKGDHLFKKDHPPRSFPGDHSKVERTVNL